MSYKDKFIERFVLDGAPASWAPRYVCIRIHRYLDQHPKFAEFFRNIGKEIAKKYTHLSPLFEEEISDGALATQRGKDSVFNIFIKLYNYGLTEDEALEYIADCHAFYQTILSHPFEITNVQIEEDLAVFHLSEVAMMDDTLKVYGKIDFQFPYDDGEIPSWYYAYTQYEMEQDMISLFDCGAIEEKGRNLINKVLSESFGLKPGEWKSKDLPSKEAICDASWSDEEVSYKEI